MRNDPTDGEIVADAVDTAATRIIEELKPLLQRIAWAIENEPFRDRRDKVKTCPNCGSTSQLDAWTNCHACNACL